MLAPSAHSSTTRLRQQRGMKAAYIVDRQPTRPPASAADRLAARLVEGIPVTARRIEVAGVSTALLDGGAGPPVVMLHGHGVFAESVGGVIAGLVDGYRILAPDLPGLGRSEPRGGQLGPDGTTEWLDRLIAATCTTPPTLVGFSAGAGVAVRYALSGSGPVRRIVLVSPCWLGAIRTSLSRRRALIRFGRRPSRASADRVARHLLFDVDRARGRLETSFSTIEDYVVERAGRPGSRMANRALPLAINRAELHRIDAPVALICGRHDPLVPIVHSERVSAELGWPIAVIHDAGHLPHLEQPRLFAAALRSAIDPDHQPTHNQEKQ
jgi:pimeloyl-ACP methyl ester carboxylesterase